MNAARTINERMLSQLPANQALEPPLKDPSQFRSAIDNMLTAQKYYDERLFGDMGVEVIWYDNHTDISAMVRQIPGR